MIGVKLCGLTRAGDAAAAAAAGADYVGVIFAGGPRLLTPSQATEVLAPTRGRALAVGVFGDDAPGSIARTAGLAALDVVQLHADPDPEIVAAVRREFGGTVWAAYRVRDGALDGRGEELFDAADGVVLDAHVPGALGGTGVALPWTSLATSLAGLGRRRAATILAGGLHAGNVADAVGTVGPDVVDVSSGVECAPGRKDHHQMQAFVTAARSATPAGTEKT